jgi:UDPglucose 6-dehydrogenase
MNNISIIGAGVIGLAVGKGFKQLGNHVIFYDVDKSLVQQLEKAGYSATADLKYAVVNSTISFICVPTPTQDSMDISQVKSAIKDLSRLLKDKSSYHLVVMKSTILPTYTERIIIPLLAKSGKKLGEEIGVCVNPEFLTEIASTWTDDKQYCRDFFTEDRIVIGEYDRKSGDILEQLYKPIGRPVFRTDLETAAMIKYASNCMLATKISFWNEIFLICQELKVDSRKVAKLVALDPRIGRYGTVHGKAFGGKCLPKDLAAFAAFTAEYHKPVLLTAVKQINEYMATHYGIRE